MRSLWIVVALLPVIIVPSLFVGFELPFYFGMALIGLSFWLYSDDEFLKFIGTQIARMGFMLSIIAFVYYALSGQFFTTGPFEFRFLKAMVEFFIEFYAKVANAIGSAITGVLY
jgi:hypothetical protein